MWPLRWLHPGNTARRRCQPAGWGCVHHRGRALGPMALCPSQPMTVPGPSGPLYMHLVIPCPSRSPVTGEEPGLQQHRPTTEARQAHVDTSRGSALLPASSAVLPLPDSALAVPQPNPKNAGSHRTCAQQNHMVHVTHGWRGWWLSWVTAGSAWGGRRPGAVWQVATCAVFVHELQEQHLLCGHLEGAGLT